MALHDRFTRRHVASSVAAFVGVVLAGCTSDASGIGDSEPEDTPIGEECERDNQELPDLKVRNEHSEPHTVDLTVTGELEDGSGEKFYEETFDLEPETEVENPESVAVRWIAFDPDREDVRRYEDFRATATTDDGQSDSKSVYSTVVSHPLRYGLRVEIRRNGQLSVSELHWDTAGNWEPSC